MLPGPAVQGGSIIQRPQESQIIPLIHKVCLFFHPTKAILFDLNPFIQYTFQHITQQEA